MLGRHCVVWNEVQQYLPLRNSWIPGKWESHFTCIWNFARPQACPSPSASLFRTCLHHPTGSQSRIKSCSLYHLNIFQFHSLISIPPSLSPPYDEPLSSFNSVTTVASKFVHLHLLCFSLMHSSLCRQSDGLKEIMSPPYHGFPLGFKVKARFLKPACRTLCELASPKCAQPHFWQFQPHNTVKGKPRGRFKLVVSAFQVRNVSYNVCKRI